MPKGLRTSISSRAGDQPFQVRYRIDGICRLEHQIPATFRRAVISRLKIMSNLDISNAGSRKAAKSSFGARTAR